MSRFETLRAEDGFAVAPALAVMVIVLALGAAVLSTVNVQTNQSGLERAQEGSFQVAESALDSQVLRLTRTWPTSAAPYPACGQASPATATCMGTALASNFTTAGGGGSGPNGGSEFAATPTWSTRVIDDVDGADYYSDTIATRTPAPCACDANANGSVWVRSEATVRGERSVVVSLVARGEPRLEALPRATIIAGWFNTTNNGKKVIVDAVGTSATAGVVAVRCNTGPAKDDPCLGYDPGKGQLSPADAYQRGYIDGTGIPNATNRRTLSSAALARLKERAQALGTYYASGCPPTIAGAMVYIESGNCSYTSNTQFNSAANPGVLIIGSGTLSLGGTSNFYGLIYAANGQGTAPASGPCTAPYQNSVINLGGNTQVYGSIMVDKCGGVNAGASGVNIVFDANVFAKVTSAGTVGSVKNTFRIIPTS